MQAFTVRIHASPGYKSIWNNVVKEGIIYHPVDASSNEFCQFIECENEIFSFIVNVFVLVPSHVTIENYA